jgi:hypothetical protein
MSGDALRWLVGGIILLAVAALFGAMVRTWRTKAARDAGTVPPVGPPERLGPPAGSWDGFAVATTRAELPLERVRAGGLGFRGRGGLTVYPEGVVMHLAGAPDRWVERAAVRGADRATWAIDRVVEPGGLVRLRWTATGAAGATDLDSYFRFPEGDAAVLRALGDLTTNTAGPRDAARQDGPAAGRQDGPPAAGEGTNS